MEQISATIEVAKGWLDARRGSGSCRKLMTSMRTQKSG